MRRTSFRWYLKKRLTEATDTGTLSLKRLAEVSERDKTMRAALALYIIAYFEPEDAKRRLKALGISDECKKYYHEDGIPDVDSLRAMPDTFHEIYDDYIRYISEKNTNVRIKTKYRQELLTQMGRQNLSQRAVGKLCEVDFACISRFLQGGDYALGKDRLKSILDTLRKAESTKPQSTFYINNYRETELAKGLIEVSFTLNISENALNALRQLCKENDISFPKLMEGFLNWLLADKGFSENSAREQNE